MGDTVRGEDGFPVDRIAAEEYKRNKKKIVKIDNKKKPWAHGKKK